MKVSSEQGAVRLVAGALLLTVASQVFYIAVVANAGDDTPLRPLTWFTELAAFSTVAIFSQALAARQPESATMWSAIAFSGLLNVLQVAMGLSMFEPALEAGEGQGQLFATVLAGAFFLYFLAKLVLGLVAFALGAVALRGGGAARRAVAALAAVSGIAAVGLNLLAMLDSQAWMLAAGAAGTATTAFLGVLLLMRASDPAHRA